MSIFLKGSASIQPRKSPMWKYEITDMLVLLMLSPVKLFGNSAELTGVVDPFEGR